MKGNPGYWPGAHVNAHCSSLDGVSVLKLYRTKCTPCPGTSEAEEGRAVAGLAATPHQRHPPQFCCPVCELQDHTVRCSSIQNGLCLLLPTKPWTELKLQLLFCHTLTGNIQEREFLEMKFSPAKLRHYEATINIFFYFFSHRNVIYCSYCSSLLLSFFSLYFSEL